MTSPASHDWPIGKQLGTLAFASAFVLGLPVLLTLWDLAAPAHFALWMPPSLVGVGIGVLGAGLYLWAIATYVARTGMLPVTLTSPDHAIVDGPFRLLNDPIYTGFCLVVAGAAIAVGHQFAFWIVTPTIILATYAYAVGYEAGLRPHRDTETALLGIPKGPAPMSRREVLLRLGLHWSVLCAGLLLLTTSSASMTWAAISLAAAVVPLSLTLPSSVPATKVRASIFASYIVCGVYLTVDYAPGLDLDGGLMPGLAAIAAGSTAAIVHGPVRWGLAAGAALIVAATWALTNDGTMLEVALVAAFGVLAGVLPALFKLSLRAANRIANSWRAWRLGSVRIINYSAYALLSATVGCIAFASLAGPSGPQAMVIIGCSTLVGAGLWGQLLENTGRLARPFGYFGAVIGALLGTLLAAWWSQTDGILLGGALAASAPWIQAIGRLRCLVQGCCHGRPVDAPEAGICYHGPQSRAVVIGGYADVPIHPTQLYSLLANVFLGLLLLRLTLSGAPASIVVAVYCIGAGCARFIEEFYRGEPQTKVVLGLKIYQWLALMLVLGGIGASLFSSAALSAPQFPSVWTVAVALLLGATYGIAMGVDLPDAGTRLSRLTPS